MPTDIVSTTLWIIFISDWTKRNHEMCELIIISILANDVRLVRGSRLIITGLVLESELSESETNSQMLPNIIRFMKKSLFGSSKIS